jgi:hypothetical protein
MNPAITAIGEANITPVIKVPTNIGIKKTPTIPAITKIGIPQKLKSPDQAELMIPIPTINPPNVPKPTIFSSFSF